MVTKKSNEINFAAALKQLKDSRAQLSTRTISALNKASKQDLVAFAPVWIDLPVERRRRASRLMVELAEENFKLDYELLFRYFLNDDDAEVRAAGIEGLWESEDATLVRPMVGFLRSDPDARVRAAAADALGHFMLLAEYGRLSDTHKQLIGEALLATIKSTSEDLSVRCRSVESIAYWSEEIVKPLIDAAYEDDAPEMRASAIAAMGRTADSVWRKIVLDELESPDPRMRFQAARACGELEHRDAAPRLIELIDDPDREVSSAAVIALGQVGGKLAKNALVETAASDDEVLSELATQAIQELDFANSAEFLLLDMDPIRNNMADDEDSDDEIETSDDLGEDDLDWDDEDENDDADFNLDDEED